MVVISIWLVICLCIVLYVYSTCNFNYWRERGIQSIRPVPFFGNIIPMLSMRMHPQDLVAWIYRSGAGLPVIGFYSFKTPYLMVRDPALIKEVLLTRFDCFSSTVAKVNGKLDPLLARNPFLLNGELWRAVKALLLPAFTAYKVKSQFPLMALECREMIQFLEKEAAKQKSDGLCAMEVAQKFAIDVVVRCGFGIIGNSFSESQGVLRDVQTGMKKMGIFRMFRILLYMLVPELQALINVEFLNRKEQNFFRQLIKELIQYRESNKVFRNDYLQMLMHIKYLGNNVNGKNTIRVAGVNMEFTDENVTSLALMLFVTGTEIPALVLTSALYELASNPQLQQRLRDEIESVLRKHNGGLTYEAVQEMPFLDMVLNETVRKYSYFLAAPRLCTKTCQLTLPGGGSLTVEQGVAVAIPTHALHMDPQYFPQPEKFDPERFSDERRASIMPFTYMPFGEGPRCCIAHLFARAEVKAGLVAVISHFEIKTTPRTPPRIEQVYQGYTTMLKDGMWLNFVRR